MYQLNRKSVLNGRRRQMVRQFSLLGVEFRNCESPVSDPAARALILAQRFLKYNFAIGEMLLGLRY